MPPREPVREPRPALFQQLQPSELVAGRFRITRLLGHGGMGEVYEANDERLHDRVALKTLRSADQRMLSRFEREVQLAKKVTHPNVCRIYDIGTYSQGQRNVFFLTMELLEGETLSRRLARGPMSATEALPIVRQMAAALDTAHQVGIVHRDFKSANVMLVPGKALGSVRAVVTGFGLVRAFESPLKPRRVPLAPVVGAAALTGRLAALRGADPVAIVPRRPRQQWTRQLIVLHL
jgi:serine/threonine protein kinase